MLVFEGLGLVPGMALAGSFIRIGRLHAPSYGPRASLEIDSPGEEVKSVANSLPDQATLLIVIVYIAPIVLRMCPRPAINMIRLDCVGPIDHACPCRKFVHRNVHLCKRRGKERGGARKSTLGRCLDSDCES